MCLKVSNIQRMCFHDGPGIRTTVFLKGCSLHCPWCSNPENVYTGGNDDIQGYETTELADILMKDRAYWGTGGGVTFSGGEALLHAKKLEPLWRLLKDEGIHLAVESALFVPGEFLKTAVEYIDFFYVDVKILEPSLCKEILGGNVEQYLENIDILTGSGRSVCFRVPCSKEYVLTKKNRGELLNFFRRYSDYPVQIFALHGLGKKKYEKMGMEMEDFEPASEQELIQFKDELCNAGCMVEIIKI
jgi:pyruvate formate lyase activating enzyme